MTDEERAREIIEKCNDQVFPPLYTPQEEQLIEDILSAFTLIRNEAIAKERERASTLLTDLSGDRGQLLLASGEMTAQELRTAGAVLRYGAHMIKRTGEHTDAEKNSSHE